MAALKSEVLDFEERYVHHAYEAITTAIPRGGKTKWQEVQRFLLSLPSGAIVCDIGCGRGHYLGVSKKHNFVFGLERSGSLCDVVQSQGDEVVRCDITNIPYRSGCLDGVVCAAVIHHLATKQRRVRAIQEIVRVLRRHGRAFISAWAMENCHRQFEGHDVLVPIRLKEWSRLTSEIKPHGKEVVPSIKHATPSADLSHVTGRPTRIDRFMCKQGDRAHHLGDRVQAKMATAYSTADSEITHITKVVMANLREYIDGHTTFRRISPVKKWRTSDQRQDCDGKNHPTVQHPRGDSHRRSKSLDSGIVAAHREPLGKEKQALTDSAHKIQKYYHVFTENEFYGLISSFSELTILDRFRDKRNWVCIVEKL